MNSGPCLKTKTNISFTLLHFSQPTTTVRISAPLLWPATGVEGAHSTKHWPRMLHWGHPIDAGALDRAATAICVHQVRYEMHRQAVRGGGRALAQSVPAAHALTLVSTGGRGAPAPRPARGCRAWP